ncbi:MAG: carbohydrate ABC transporter substrate-binding protein [Lachnospiraceae bacterium]|nr:carbohydrate ABC transporter substrate-binding protein [Lachnospiraceae bacterium]
MKKKIISSLLAASMIMTALTGCGGTDSGNNNATQDNATTVNNDSANNADNAQEPADAAPEGDDAAPEGGDAAASNEGKVINVYSFNDELRTRITAVYPEVVDTSDDGTTSSLKDGTEIHWIINPNQDGVYQDKLDEALNNQLTAADDDKVDIFAAEIDYVVKYTDADIDAAMPLEALGINPETDLADQFDFTKTVASDQNGVMRASTWQACPGVLVYRRDIANEVFGTDDPEVIGEKTKDWDAMKATAEELKAKGYYTFSCYTDTFRTYSNNISEPWVAPGETTIKVDQKIIDWVTDSKEWKDAGYFDPAVKGQWNADWFTAMSSSSKVFAFLFPAWGIDTQLKPNWDGENGAWAVTNAPLSYNWGGTFVLAAEGTDNPGHVKDILLALTADADNLKMISKEYADFTNAKTLMEAAKTDNSFASDFLGGQNPYTYFTPGADAIEMAPLSAYDQGCVELIQNAFGDYLQGQIDYDKAKQNFETAVRERYPEISEIQWPE